MKLTKRLLSALHRVFDKDPDQFLAISVQNTSELTWTVSDGFLTTSVASPTGTNLSIDLSQYTLASLVGFISSQPGYSVSYADTSLLSQLSALVLLDSSGDLSKVNGGNIYGYQNELWSYLEAQASELEIAKSQVGNMLQQMSTTTAQNEWLDYLGKFYGVKRGVANSDSQSGAQEPDSQYGPRIIATVLRPCCNNVALQEAITAYTQQPTQVINVVEYGLEAPFYNGVNEHNSAIEYNSVAHVIYGLFDVVYGYDLLNGSDITSFQQTVVTLINTLRAAGTHLRAISLSGSVLADSLTPPTDGAVTLPFNVSMPFADTLTPPIDSTSVMPIGMAAFSDSLIPPTDVENLSIKYGYSYSGMRSYNGIITYAGGTVEHDTL